MQELLNRIPFKFMVNYHSYGQLLLYSFGWQVQTPSADNPIFLALSGTDANPAIPGFDPGVGADLYTTNGETTDYAHARTNTLAWTPELGEGIPGNGFVFPDDEELVQQEFLTPCLSTSMWRNRLRTRPSRSLTWATQSSRSISSWRRSSRSSPGIHRETFASMSPTATRRSSRCWQPAHSEM